ncbi:MAG: hypothetical protein JWN78_1787, partial [Bacteroidota bacterium]|nr:hypothetical protein [Bacteroidota bacterium]
MATDNFTRVCGQDDLTKYFRSKLPDYDAQVDAMFKELYDSYKNRNAAAIVDDTVYTVRVVIHMVYLSDDSVQNIPDFIVNSEIDAMNRDYNMLNEDTSNLRSIFKRFRGNPGIKFELAKFDPQGNPTNGIDRVAGKGPSIAPATALDSLIGATDDWFKKGYTERITNGKKDTTIGARSWDNKHYLNIWVTNLNLFRDVSQGTLGGFAYAPPGLSNWPLGIGYPSDTADGLSIDYRFFGQNNYYAQAHPNIASVIGKGRTVVHECGHYLGLRHTWGDYGNLLGGDCSNILTAALFFNDGIDDTPFERSPFSSAIHGYRCDTTINTCSIPYNGVDYPDLFEDYMDYSGDACYNLFTKQQVAMIRRVLRTRRSGIIVKKEISTATIVQRPQLKDEGISFYPNPSKDIMNIHLDKIMLNDVALD